MRSARSELLLVVFFLFLIAFPLPVFAVEEEPQAGKLLTEFEGIKLRLANIEREQKDILAQKNKIVGEIDRLRVWVRHSGGK